MLNGQALYSNNKSIIEEYYEINRTKLRTADKRVLFKD